MKREILIPNYEREKDLWRRLYELVFPGKTGITKETSIDMLCSFGDVSDISTGVGCYTKMRMRLLYKLISYASSADLKEEITFIPDSLWSKEDTSMFISLVRVLFDMHQYEKLVVIFYTDSLNVKSVYESESAEWFSCPSEKERLKAYVNQNAPSNIVMIHSHPGSSVTVSDDDIRFTQSVMTYAQSLGSVLTEHFIITCYGSADDFVGILGNYSNDDSDDICCR